MSTFIEKERICEREFDRFAPFWHIFTNGQKMDNLFCSKEEMKQGMLALAIAAALCPKVRIITFELMNNHVHLIVSGECEECLELFSIFRRRLMRVLSSLGKIIGWDCFQADILEIENLKALRNEIAYVNRNAFVADYRYTPFSYPWGGGWAYFSPVVHLLPSKSVSEMGLNAGRRMTRCRNLEMLGNIRFVEDVVFIPSFCRIDIGESMFHDARSYFYSLTRNAEAFSQTALRLKDMVFLTDDEMYQVAIKYADTKFNSRQLSLLTPENRIEMAKELHFKYNASNQQLKRILRLAPAILDELFP